MISIDKGIAVPKSARSGVANLKPREPKYPFAQMGVGDSFAVDIDPIKGVDSTMDRLRSSSSAWRKRTGTDCSFAVRLVTEEGIQKVRVWMLEGKGK